MLLDLLTGRRPKASAGSPQELMELLTRGRTTRSGMVVNPDSAMRATAVYACIRVLAEGIAQVPLLTYRRRPDGGKERLTQHWLWKLLYGRPNRWQTSFEFREMMMGHVGLRGNFYAWKNMVDRGARVQELVPLHPDRMEPEQLDNTDVLYHYTFRNGDRRTFNQREIFHLRGLSMDGVVGIDPIAYQRESIGLYMAAERHGANFFGNGAQPSGVLKHPKQLSDEAHKHLKQSLQEEYGGESSGNPMVLEEGMEWQQLGISNENSQFLETYKFKRSEIASMFRVPPHMIGDLERATFSNIEQQSLDFVIYTLLPWMTRVEQAMHRDLVPDSRDADMLIEHLVEGLLRGDSTARKDFYVAMLEHGVMNPDEVREKENMNPRQDGNGGQYYYPGNLNRADGGDDAATEPNAE